MLEESQATGREAEAATRSDENVLGIGTGIRRTTTTGIVSMTKGKDGGTVRGAATAGTGTGIGGIAGTKTGPAPGRGTVATGRGRRPHRGGIETGHPTGERDMGARRLCSGVFSRIPPGV